MLALLAWKENDKTENGKTENGKTENAERENQRLILRAEFFARVSTARRRASGEGCPAMAKPFFTLASPPACWPGDGKL
jgi:hypothetical protein